MDAKKNLIIDIVALLIYLVVANPAFTGIGVHEWIGLGLFVVLLVHCIAHADWVEEALRSGFTKPSWTQTGNLVLDILALIAFLVVTVSGIMISGAVLPALGLYAEGYYFWDPLHAISAKILLALLLVHVVVHWKWFALFIKKGKSNGHTE
ncbi:MAG: DUF4405 domain-containing protein [Raoultibacter sp.]